MMRRILVPAALLILAGAAAAPAAADTAVACSASPTGVELAAEWEAAFTGGTIVAPEAEPATHPLPPPCPEERDCTGPVGNGNTCDTNPANCGVSGLSTLVDSGLSLCTMPGGKILRCKTGTTVHTRVAQCSQCPCCVPDPFACLCPNDCGSVVRIAGCF